MITPAHYPYSTTYLATRMSRISRGFVVVGLAALCWIVVAFAAVGAWQVLT